MRPPFDAHGERQVSGAADLWFRNGGRPADGNFHAVGPSIENLHRIEFSKLSAGFRRIYFNENTYALSTTVSQNEAAA
jgi:hypothetical protein